MTSSFEFKKYLDKFISFKDENDKKYDLNSSK